MRICAFFADLFAVPSVFIFCQVKHEISVKFDSHFNFFVIIIFEGVKKNAKKIEIGLGFFVGLNITPD